MKIIPKKRSKFNGLIYLIENQINNKKYIGKTSRSLNKRWSEHKYDSKNSNSYLHRAMRKYGFENFSISILEKVICDNLENFNNKLNKLEQYYISQFDTCNNGYNLTLGGDGSCGYTISQDHKNAVSKAHKGIPLSEEHKEKIAKFMQSDKNPNIGRKHSNESIQKLSESRKGKCVGKNNPMYGVKRKDLSERNLQSSIKVCQIDLISGKLIKIWDSLRECSRVTGFNRNCVSDCCKGKTKQSHGFLWKYYSDYLKDYNKNEVTV